MAWKNRSSVGLIVVLLTLLGLVLGPGTGLSHATPATSPILISLDVKQMDLQDVLRLIAEKANVNIIAGREVDGEITLRLKNVDLWQALGAVLDASGCTYREEDGIIRVVKAKKPVEVKPPLLQTEIIFLEFTKAEEIKEAFQHLLSTSGTMEADPASNALIVTDVAEDIENIKKGVAELEEAAREKIEKEEIEEEKIQEIIENIKKRVAELEEAAIEKIEKEELLPPERFQLNYINVEEKKDILTEVLGNIIKEEGAFFLDSLTNSVYVQAPPSCIEKVKEYFQGADVAPKRIMIRAEFVEVRLEDLKEFGIKWRWKGAYEKYPLGATFRYPYYVRAEPGEQVPAAPRAPLSTLAGAMGIIFGSVEQEFRGIIDLLISEDKANLLSSPSIVTLDGQEARIHVGDRYPYKIKSWKEGELFETTEFIDLGTTLLVTPRIKAEKKVVLDIHPEVMEVTAPERWEGGPPVVGTRDTRTKIEVEEGNSIVIGGLLKNIEIAHREGVPVLSRLPIIGSLFTYRKIEKKKTDLLIFITPNILPDKLEEENMVEKRKPLRVQMDELLQKGLDYKENGEYEKAREYFQEVAKMSQIYGLSDYLESAEKELVDIDELEEQRLEEQRLEEQRLEKERLGKERLEKERLEKERLEKEKKEKERSEKIEKAKLEKIEKAKLEEERLEKKTLVKEIYQKGLTYKKDGEYEKAREYFQELIKMSRIYGLSDYLKYAERELVKVERLEKARLEKEEREKARLEKARLEEERREKERLEKERIEKERLEKERLEKERREQARLEKIEKAKLEEERTRKERLEKKKTEKKPVLALGVGGWYPSSDSSSLMIYEAQVRLKENLRLFGAGCKSSDKSSYVSYFGVRIGDRLNVGVGGMNSSALEKTKLMFTGGFSLGTDRVRLEGNYFYVPENDDANGIKAILGMRF